MTVKTETFESPKNQRDAWVKYSWVWSIVFYVAWLFQSYREIFHGFGNPWPEPLWIAILTTVAMILYTVLWRNFVVTTKGVRQYSHKAAILVVTIMLIWFAESMFAVSHLWALSSIIILNFVYLPPKQATASMFFACILAGTASNFVEGTADFTWNGWIFQVLFFMVFGMMSILGGLWFDKIVNQSYSRKMLIEELNKTQAALAKSEREKGILAERQRLAHEIHDTLAQGFTSIVMEMEAAEGASTTGQTQALPHIQRARETARRSLQQARHVVNDLRADELAEMPFETVMMKEVARWQEETGIATIFKSTGEQRSISADIEHTLLRVTQESLNNIRKYAQATQVRVTLSYLADCVIVDVQDDGVGMSATKHKQKSDLSGGVGLHTMRERIERLKGEFTVETSSAGTIIGAQVPTSLL